MVLMGGSMDKVKELWALAKGHKKISIAVAAIFILVN